MPDMNAPMEGGAKPAPNASASPIVRRRPGHSVLAHPRFVLWSFTATTFLSALLLFSVQPMFAKMVLRQLASLMASELRQGSRSGCWRGLPSFVVLAANAPLLQGLHRPVIGTALFFSIRA